MSGPLSVTLSDFYMAKMEDAIVEKHQPKFYKHYVGDRWIVVKKNQVDLCSMTKIITIRTLI